MRDADEQADYQREQLERSLQVALYERDHARAHRERLMVILVGIHALLNPEHVTRDGKTFAFSNPYANQMLDELSRRIRAIPEEIDKAAAPHDLARARVFSGGGL